MKKIISMACFIFLLTIGAAAYEMPIDITVNGYYIKSDVKPYIKNSLTYVPVRFVSEALGCEVYWEDGTAIVKGEKTIILYPSKNYAFADGEKIELEGTVELISDRTFVPLRFIAETLGCKVDWDGNCYFVEIEKEDIEVKEEFRVNPEYNKDTIFWLARIIEAESAGESLEGKIAVGNVVLNRVESESFPDTVYGVIFDRNYGIQFQPVMNGAIYNEPSGESYIAAKLALNGNNTAGESLYFLNPNTASDFWIIYNRDYVCSIGNHDFYL